MIIQTNWEHRGSYKTTNHGHKIAVLLPIDNYNNMLEQLEEMYDIKAFDAAKASDDEVIPFDQAVKEIEAKRNDL